MLSRDGRKSSGGIAGCPFDAVLLLYLGVAGGREADVPLHATGLDVSGSIRQGAAVPGVVGPMGNSSAPPIRPSSSALHVVIVLLPRCDRFVLTFVTVISDGSCGVPTAGSKRGRENGCMKLIGLISPTETRELEGEGKTYAEAREAIAAQLPEGWRLLSIREP